MAKKMLLVALMGLTTLLLSSRYIDHTPKDQATVNQYQGVYVFIQSRPAAEYAVLGTVKTAWLVWNGHPRGMTNNIIRKAKHDYPQCDGIIFDNLQLDHGTVIRFK